MLVSRRFAVGHQIGEDGGALRGGGDGAPRSGDVVFLEKFLGLVLVDVHAGSSGQVFGNRKGKVQRVLRGREAWKAGIVRAVRGSRAPS